MKTTNEIKKSLYREKPIAQQTAYLGEYKHYVSQLADKTIIEFHVPNSEATFESNVPAQLLIRYLKD